MKSMTAEEKVMCRRLWRSGESLEAIASAVGHSAAEVRLYLVRVINLQKHNLKTGGHRADTLCWSCHLASGRLSRRTGEQCPWAAKGNRPVPGWTAEVTERDVQDSYGQRHVKGYLVRECPLYEPDREGVDGYV